MKKIFNWFFGSFFRSLGRFISFLFILLVLSIILTKLNINLPFMSITDVSAATIGGAWVDDALYQECEYANGVGSCDWPNLGSWYNTGSGQYYDNNPVWHSPSNFRKFPYKIILVTDNLRNLCTDSTTTFSGSFNISGSGNNMSFSSIKAYNSAVNKATSCAFSTRQETDLIVDFTCTGNFNSGDTNIEAYYGDYSFSSSSPDRYLYVYFNLTYTCNTDGTGAIIDNNNQNTQNIINNQNNNTQQIVDSQNNINNSLNDANTDEATNSAENFFSGFQSDTFGLTSIITVPLNLIQSITNSSCSPLGLPLPYVNKTLELPCLTSIYEEYFGVFLTIYQTITFGIVSYWVLVRFFNLVKDFKNPEHDEIEVVDL